VRYRIISNDTDPEPITTAGIQQDLPDLTARAQMLRHRLGTGRREAAEVDHPAHAGLLGRGRERLGGAAVGLAEVASAAQRVDQVVRDVDALDRAAYGPGIGQVRADDLHLVAPRMAAQPLW
jgi:hypothetical protein